MGGNSSLRFTDVRKDGSAVEGTKSGRHRLPAWGCTLKDIVIPNISVAA